MSSQMIISLKMCNKDFGNFFPYLNVFVFFFFFLPYPKPIKQQPLYESAHLTRPCALLMCFACRECSNRNPGSQCLRTFKNVLSFVCIMIESSTFCSCHLFFSLTHFIKFVHLTVY